jgi:hypothetical protein
MPKIPAGDLKELLDRADAEDDEQRLIDVGHLRPSYLTALADELYQAFEMVEEVSIQACRLVGSDYTIAGDGEEFVRLDAAHAWHLTDFANCLEAKSAELHECAERVKTAAHAGWQNTLDHEVMNRHA